MKQKMKIYVISEENHGEICYAKTLLSAKKWLIDNLWITGCTGIWCYHEQKSHLIGYIHEDWKSWVLNEATLEDFNNMGFGIYEEILIE